MSYCINCKHHHDPYESWRHVWRKGMPPPPPPDVGHRCLCPEIPKRHVRKENFITGDVIERTYESDCFDHNSDGECTHFEQAPPAPPEPEPVEETMWRRFAAWLNR